MIRTRLAVLLAALLSLACTLSAVAGDVGTAEAKAVDVRARCVGVPQVGEVDVRAARTMVAEARSPVTPPRFVFLLEEPRFDTASDSSQVLVPSQAGAGGQGSQAESTAVEGRVPGGPDSGHRENSKIVGGSFLASGVFLSGWGIISWQFEEDQCCPTRNTENVLKIVVGVVLINAGLAYLLGVLG